MAVYIEAPDESAAPAPPEEIEAEVSGLPPLEAGQRLGLVRLEPKQHFTQPPPRYTEASLVKELEEKGIGRPSTYAQILTHRSRSASTSRKTAVPCPRPIWARR